MVESAYSKKHVRRRGAIAWLDPRGRRIGYWAFVLHRLTGLGLVLYLGIHLWVLNMLRQGPTRWNDFVTLAKSPLFLLLDVILLFGVLFHGLNGIRVTLVGMGLAVTQHKRLFWALMVGGPYY
jgi:succinate dehydrogenase, cytochrome b556 subunit